MELNKYIIFQDEIRTRSLLLDKIANHVKLSEDERIWLETHKEFSQLMGIPFLKQDVIELEQGVAYQFHVKYLESHHPYQIYPCFKAPCFVGSITTDTELVNSRGGKCIGRPVKMLATMINQENTDFWFSYASDYGILLVKYFCQYYDEKQHLKTGRFSDFGDGLCMLRKDVSLNSVLYRCNAHNAEDFDSLAFLVEWTRMKHSL